MHKGHDDHHKREENYLGRVVRPLELLSPAKHQTLHAGSNAHQRHAKISIGPILQSERVSQDKSASQPVLPFALKTDAKDAMEEGGDDLKAAISCKTERTHEPNALGVGSIDSLGMIRLTLGKMNSLLFINGDLLRKDSLPGEETHSPMQLDKSSKQSPASRPSLVPQAKAFKEEARRQSAVGQDGERLLMCNCKRSHCLKFYCDCLSVGRKCTVLCNCHDCENDSAHEEERAELLQSRGRTERQEGLFEMVKVTGKWVKRHRLGCGCSRSGCLKEYCECHKNGVKCHENCKCKGCKNKIDVNDNESSLSDEEYVLPMPKNARRGAKRNKRAHSGAAVPAPSKKRSKK